MKELLFTATAVAFEKEKGKRWSERRGAADSTRVGVEKRRIGADVDKRRGRRREGWKKRGVRVFVLVVHKSMGWWSQLLDPPDGASDLVYNSGS